MPAQNTYHTDGSIFGWNPIDGLFTRMETTTDGGIFAYPESSQTYGYDSMEFAVTEYLPGGGSIKHDLMGSTSYNNDPISFGGSSFVRDALKVTAPDGVTSIETGTSSSNNWWMNNDGGNQGTYSNLEVFKNLSDANGNANVSLNLNTGSSGDMAGFTFGNIADMMSSFGNFAAMHGINVHPSMSTPTSTPMAGPTGQYASIAPPHQTMFAQMGSNGDAVM